MPINKQIHLDNRPDGEAVAGNFKLVSAETPALADNQVLVRHHYMSLDPYMRGRMNDSKSYAQPQPLGQVMQGGTAGEVVESKHPRFAVGDKVVGFGGWQEYSVVDASQPGALKKVDTTHVPLSHYLGAVGMPGVTAWYGLVKIIAPKAGETMVVTAASGAVGSAFGALAKARGCRAVGIAGGPDKCRYVVTELGFDACIDHRAPDLREQLAAACPKGVDVYFENVGGAVLEAVWPLLNTHARVSVCGLIAQYNDTTPRPGPDLRSVLSKRIMIRGFIILDHAHRFDAFLADMGAWVRDGKVKYREDIVEGIARAPEALIGLLQGRNFGKLLVRVAAA